MKGFGWMGLGVGLFLGAVGLAVVDDSIGSVAVPAPVQWATVLPVGALTKVPPSEIANVKHEVAVGKVRRVVVSIPERKLVLVADGRVVKVYRVAVGARVSPSPRGEFRIAVRIPEATYYHAGVVIPSGEQSPIGTRWIGLNQAGYGIHGTNAPGSIGKASSHGCIRMRNRDAEELFEMVRVGDVVEIRDEEVTELAAANGDGASSGE
jgi:lipoprotein-anchoring transpeptidase ErfK/SrfK